MISPAPLELVSPRVRPRKLDSRPAWWRAAVEIETRDYRERRAAELEAGALERKSEAELVRDALLDAEHHELGWYQFADELRELPGASAEIKDVIRRWDAELSVRSIGRKRLHRSSDETVEIWRARVLAECDRRIDSKWHEQRAGGQRERFRRVERCGKTIRGRITCRSCSSSGEWMPDLCNVALLCQRCRNLRLTRYRARVSLGIEAATEAVRKNYLGPGQARRDPIAARFLTLTCPHLPLDVGGPELQARTCRLAWRSFMNSLRNRWRAVQKETRPNRWREVLDLSAFVRCIEFTSGTDELAHVHMHAWILSTFTRAQVIRILWGRALLAAKDPETKQKLFPRELWPEHATRKKSEILDELSGRAKAYQEFGNFVRALGGAGDLTEAVRAHRAALAAASGQSADRDAYRYVRKSCPAVVPYPRIDVRRVRGSELEGGGSVVAELVKYLCKDFEPNHDGGDTLLIDPSLFAAVYRGLDSGRLMSAARGFWVRVRLLCPCCGAWGSLRLVIATPEDVAKHEHRGRDPCLNVRTE